MSSDLTTVAADVHGFLKSSCPTKWKIANVETLTSAPVGVCLTYEQLDLAQEIPGQPQLPVGFVWVTFQLVLSAPETDAVKGLARATTETATLLQILDGSPDIAWGPEATRIRFETGESGYVIPFAVIAANPLPTPTPEPEPAPPTPESEED